MSLQAASHGRVLPGLPVDSLHARVHSGAALGGTGPHTVISLSGRRRPWAVTRFHRAQIHSCIFGLASALLLSVLDAIATCFLSDSVSYTATCPLTSSTFFTRSPTSMHVEAALQDMRDMCVQRRRIGTTPDTRPPGRMGRRA